ASAVLCLASALFWVKTYSHSDSLLLTLTGAVWGIGALHGEIEIDVSYVSYVIPANTMIGGKWAGFGWYSRKNGNQILIAEVMVPFWSVALASGMLPLAAICMHIRY